MDEWREPTGREGAVIDAALAFNFAGRDELATQLVGARVTDDCGCGSFRVEHGYVAYVECRGLRGDPVGLPKPESLYLWA